MNIIILKLQILVKLFELILDLYAPAISKNIIKEINHSIKINFPILNFSQGYVHIAVKKKNISTKINLLIKVKI